VQVGEKTILDRQLAQLAVAGIGRVVIAAGHAANLIEKHISGMKWPEIRLATNPEYRTTNNAISLLCAQPFLEPGSFLLCDGDVVMSGDPLSDLQKAPGSALLVDQRPSLGQEEMKVCVENGLVTHLSKEIDPSTAFGESIGIQKIAARAVPPLWEELAAMKSEGRINDYYEEAFTRLMGRGYPFLTVPIPTGSWTEIDDVEDLEYARRLF
jgi:choline kinase